jgi:hypothetical protein
MSMRGFLRRAAPWLVAIYVPLLFVSAMLIQVRERLPPFWLFAVDEVLIIFCLLFLLLLAVASYRFTVTILK